jgi:SGNH hydrolase-like domain, acetyltransferase AlgX
LTPGASRSWRRSASRPFALALLVTVLLLWLLPSDVPRLIARQDDVLLGRYSEAHFVIAVLSALLLCPAAFMLWRGVGALEVLARIVLATVGAYATFAVASIASYSPAKQRYLETPVQALVTSAPVPLEGITLRRQPGKHFELERADRPGPARSYPRLPAGFPESTVVLTTDADGFRNPSPAASFDVVISGDSFAEGSMVTDEDVWGARLARLLDRPIHNVAVSGATPRIVLNNLLAFGGAGKPKLAIVSIYEGNDFKDHGTEVAALNGSSSSWLDRLAAWRRLAFKESPLRARLKHKLIGSLGPLDADAPVRQHLGLSWMPVSVEGPAGRVYYAFEPRELLRLAVRRDRFERSPAWTQNAAVLRQIAGWARASGMELLLVYVPSKPHVVMPLVRERVSPEALRAFLAFEKSDLPPAERLAETLYADLDTVENMFFELCRAESIQCASLTAPLREAVGRGVQVFFSYDQHWTPLGHALVAEQVAARIREGGLMAASDH